MSNSTLTALLGLGDDEDDSPPKPKILPEAAIMRLKDVCASFRAPNPFKIGDLVTPKSDSGMTQVGDPHIVVEIEDDPYPFWGQELSMIGSSAFGHLVNVRVAAVSDRRDTVGMWWVHHWQIEPYVIKED